MPAHKESRDLPYSVDQMFDLVADVASYPDFLPWTQSARVRSKKEMPDGEELVADLVISFKVFKERYTSLVRLKPAREPGQEAVVDVEAIDGPFERLLTHYRFEPTSETTCRMHLEVDFAFRNRLLQSAAGMAFGLAVSRISEAFETRARELYGAQG